MVPASLFSISLCDRSNLDFFLADGQHDNNAPAVKSRDPLSISLPPKKSAALTPYSGIDRLYIATESSGLKRQSLENR